MCMQYILLISFLFFGGYFYFYSRKFKYIGFYYEMDKLCLEYNLWQHRKGIKQWDDNFDNAFDFCRTKYKLPINMPLSLIYSFKPININNMLDKEIKQKFEKYLLDDM